MIFFEQLILVAALILFPCVPQLPTFWEDDLQSIVQMGIAQNKTQTRPGEIKLQSKANDLIENFSSVFIGVLIKS